MTVIFQNKGIENDKIVVTSARWQSRRSTNCIPLQHSHLEAIQGQKCHCGSFAIQVGVHETLVESKTEEGHFEKAGSCSDDGLANCGPGYNQETALWTVTVPFDFGPAISTICQGTCQESCLFMPCITGPQNSVPCVDPEVAHDPASAPLSHDFYPFGDQVEDTPVCAPVTGPPTLFQLQILK